MRQLNITEIELIAGGMVIAGGTNPYMGLAGGTNPYMVIAGGNNPYMGIINGGWWSAPTVPGVGPGTTPLPDPALPGRP